MTAQSFDATTDPAIPSCARRRVGALALSLLLHVGFALLALGTMKGALVSGGNGAPEEAVQAVDISLAGLRRVAQPASADPSAEAVATLFAKIRAQQSELMASDKPSKPKADLQKLFDLIDQERADTDATSGGAGKSQTDKGGRGAADNGDRNQTAGRRGKVSAVQRPGGAGSELSTGNLWGQIKPCWDKLPSVATVPVTLVITLDDRGQIAVPPTIIRPGGAAADERRLISEARALAAVTACVPYEDVGLLDQRRRFEVRFKR